MLFHWYGRKDINSKQYILAVLFIKINIVFSLKYLIHICFTTNNYNVLIFYIIYVFNLILFQFFIKIFAI